MHQHDLQIRSHMPQATLVHSNAAGLKQLLLLGNFQLGHVRFHLQCMSMFTSMGLADTDRLGLHLGGASCAMTAGCMRPQP